MAHEVDALMRHARLDLDAACQTALVTLERFGGHGGLIAVGASGIVARFTSEGMTRAWRVGEGARSSPRSALTTDRGHAP